MADDIKTGDAEITTGSPPADKPSEAALRLEEILGEVTAARNALGDDAHAEKFAGDFISKAKDLLTGHAEENRGLTIREARVAAIVQLVLAIERSQSGC